MELLAAYAPWQIAAALGAALGSAFVRGLTGFGMAILLVPILALALPPVESVLLANFLSLFIGVTDVRGVVRGAEGSAWRVSLLVVLFTPLGLLALAATSDDLARFLIAMI
ncbi:MAG: sulfite exporter TauE/SafE family protein, partial [Pseudomonadota bacterium]|nr:sulfite exporter TauE/SafE family protein [Pseudomonadota bacterium]